MVVKTRKSWQKVPLPRHLFVAFSINEDYHHLFKRACLIFLKRKSKAIKYIQFPEEKLANKYSTDYNNEAKAAETLETT